MHASRGALRTHPPKKIRTLVIRILILSIILTVIFLIYHYRRPLIDHEFVPSEKLSMHEVLGIRNQTVNHAKEQICYDTVEQIRKKIREQNQKRIENSEIILCTDVVHEHFMVVYMNYMLIFSHLLEMDTLEK
jgi:predicted Holliday junction resolvase-like endonuclease